jgi:hypothetical protein
MKTLKILLLLAGGFGLALTRLPLRAQDATAMTDRPTAEFHFARLMYNGVGSCDVGGGYGRGWGRGGGAACVDWFDAEYHFMQGLTRLTRIDGALVSHYDGSGGRQISLTDEAIFDYPWLYAVEVGNWVLDPLEAARLREYLLRGGFLMVDDFHGNYEWQVFHDSIVRVFPDRPTLDIADTDEVLHVLYDLDQRIQIPGLNPILRGQTWEGPDGTPPHWRGIYDDNGRLMVAINHNMDLGDAWEHADTPVYPEPMTALAYRFAVNYVIYAITH